jgi:flagellar hook-length control protein FliK
MAVQMASSASDLAQVCAPAKAAAVSGDGGAEFKNILQGMRESKQKMPDAAPKEPKTPVNFAFLAGEGDEPAADAEPAATLPEELELTPDCTPEASTEVSPPALGSDIFPEAPEAAIVDKLDDETDEPEPEEKTEDAESVSIPAEGEARPALSEINTPDAPAPMNVPDEINRETEPDAENAPDRPAGISVRTAVARKDETDDQTVADISRRPKPRESQNPVPDELPDADESTENTDVAEREAVSDGEKEDSGIGEKSGQDVPKAASRADDAEKMSSVKASGEKMFAEKISPEKEPAERAPSDKVPPEKASTEKILPENPSAERADGQHVPAPVPFAAAGRAEVSAPVQLPVIYTLMSADKFGEGLRSVMTVMTRDGGAEARIVVEPPALGRVDISLRASESGVEANFRVDSEELRQMVQKQLDSLKESLQLQGIHVSGMTVDIKNNEGERNRGNAGASKKGRRAAARFGGDDEDAGDGARVLRLDLEKGLLHWVA